LNNQSKIESGEKTIKLTETVLKLKKPAKMGIRPESKIDY
jgi:hypothetical protein